MLRPRLSRDRQGGAAAGSRLSRSGMVRDCFRSGKGKDHRHSRNRTCFGRQTAADSPRDRSTRIVRRLSGQGPDRPFGRAHVHSRHRPPRLRSRPVDVSESRSATKVGDIPKPFAGPPGAERTSSFIHTSTKPSPARFAHRLSPIPQIPFTRRLPSAAPLKTPATSQPSITRAKARRQPPQSSIPMAPCSATSPTAKRAC